MICQLDTSQSYVQDRIEKLKTKVTVKLTDRRRPNKTRGVKLTTTMPRVTKDDHDRILCLFLIGPTGRLPPPRDDLRETTTTSERPGFIYHPLSTGFSCFPEGSVGEQYRYREDVQNA